MSAKKPRKPSPAPAPAAPSAAAAAASAPAESAPPAWIDSPDPRRRQIAQVILGLVWLYVAALGLLALDQWFNWGIFGPKLPPLP